MIVMVRCGGGGVGDTGFNSVFVFPEAHHMYACYSSAELKLGSSQCHTRAVDVKQCQHENSFS